MLFGAAAGQQQHFDGGERRRRQEEQIDGAKSFREPLGQTRQVAGWQRRSAVGREQVGGIEPHRAGGESGRADEPTPNVPDAPFTVL